MVHRRRRAAMGPGEMEWSWFPGGEGRGWGGGVRLPRTAGNLDAKEEPEPREHPGGHVVAGIVFPRRHPEFSDFPSSTGEPQQSSALIWNIPRRDPEQGMVQEDEGGYEEKAEEFGSGNHFYSSLGVVAEE